MVKTYVLTDGASQKADRDYVMFAGDHGNYIIELRKTKKGVFRLTCTCEAGERGLHCKHRVALLKGDVSRIEVTDIPIAMKIIDELKDSKIVNTLKEWESAVQSTKEWKQAFIEALKGT